MSLPTLRDDTACPREGAASTGPKRGHATSGWAGAAFLLLVVASLVLRVWYGLELNSYWDEKYTLQNAFALAESGNLEPVQGYYPLLSYLPLAGATSVALKILDSEPPAKSWPPPRIRGAVFAFGRILQVLYGALALLMLYLLGRHLFDERVAMLAVLATAFAPFQIWGSAYLKPDALLSFTALTSLFLTIRALAVPCPGRYVAAGLGVALAMSSKAPGGMTAVSLALGTAILAAPWRRRAWLLALAGGTSVAAFWLLNPYWRINLEYLGVLRGEYAVRAAKRGLDRLGGLIEFLRFVHELLGPMLTAFLCLGVPWLAWRCFTRRAPAERRAREAALLAYPLFLIPTYFVQTPLFQGSNFVPVSPLLFLVSIAALVKTWDVLGGQWRQSCWLSRVAWAATAALCLVWIQAGFLSVYRTLIPTTRTAACRLLNERLAMHDGPAVRLIYLEKVPLEEPDSQDEVRLSDPRWSLTEVEQLDGVGNGLLDLADGEVFQARRLDGGDPDFFRYRMARAGEVHHLRSQPFRLRGPHLVALSHPWQMAEPSRDLATGSTDGGPSEAISRLPPDLRPEELISLAIGIPIDVMERIGSVPRCRIGSQPVELRPTSVGKEHVLLVTDRLHPREAHATIVLQSDAGPIVSREVVIELYRWMIRPESPG